MQDLFLLFRFHAISQLCTGRFCSNFDGMITTSILRNSGENRIFLSLIVKAWEKKRIATNIAKSTTTTTIHLFKGGMFLAKLRVRFFCLYFSGNLLGMWEHYRKFHQMTIAHCFYRLFSMCVACIVGLFLVLLL